MHEMNGGRYSRSNDPRTSKKHEKEFTSSLETQGSIKIHIQFIFSFNRHDMPVVNGQKPSQSAEYVSCTPAKKKESKCLTREDYYPGVKL